MTYLSLLSCPHCQSVLTLKKELNFFQSLSCEKCQLQIPVIQEFALFTESFDLGISDRHSNLDRLIQYFEPDNLSYQQYIIQKSARNILEIYSALQPFNESTRALYPFLSKLQATLQPHDIIIDTWSRTGWHALLLAGLFPQQQIISVWEGNHGVLGYSGYGYWFSSAKRPQNLNIIFAAPGDKLPFKDDIAKLVIAHDVLHRRDRESYADELLRICDREGVILAPHIHLNNQEPNPYFDRGGTLRSGGTYHDYYNDRLAGSNRTCLVLSEVDLFNHADDRPLQDNPHGGYCNALLAIAKKSWLDQNFSNEVEHIPVPTARLIPNPLLQVNPISRCIELKPQGLGDRVRYYLDRHPCYEARLTPSLGQQLDLDGIELLIASQQAGTLADYAQILGWSVGHTQSVAHTLQQYELIAALPVAAIAIELQNFHANQHSLLPNSFKDFWQNSIETTPDRYLLTLEGESLSISEVNQLMLAICSYYLKHGLDRGRSIQIDPTIDRSKQLILMMAAWWLSISISEESEIDLSCFVVTDDFWNIIESHIDDPISLESADRSLAKPPLNIIERQESAINWHETLLIFAKS